MKFYLAGPSAELDRVRAAAEAIDRAGHVITEPWWERSEEARRNGWTSDADVPEAFMRESAERNERGMDLAQATIALCRSEGGLSVGTSYEVGFSKSMHDVVIVGDPRGHVGCWTYATVVSSIEEALALFAHGAPRR